MTGRTVTTLPSHVFMVVFVAIFFAYVDLHLFFSGALSFPATYLFLAALAGFAGVLLIQAVVSARIRGEIVALYMAHAWVWAALVAIVFCTYAGAFLPGAYWEEGPRYLLFPIYDGLVIFLSLLLTFRAHHRRHFRRYLLVAFIVFLASVFVDAWRPGTFSPIPDRAAGFADNPNIGAFALVLLCACLIDLERQRSRDLVLITLTSAGVLATLSRGGGILLALVVAYHTYRTVGRNGLNFRLVLRRGAVVVLLLTMVGLTGMFLVGRAEMFSLSFQPRLGMLQDTRTAVNSDDDRIEALTESITLLAKSPVIGYGTGFTNSLVATPHNIYIQQWVNNGLAGLGAYLFFIGACARLFWKRHSLRGLLFMALVTINGFFSHNILEERAVLALLGVLLSSSFYDARSDSAPAEAAARGQRAFRLVRSTGPAGQFAS